MAATADFLLPPSVLRNLTDRSFDKRRLGAVETEKVVRALRASSNRDGVRRVILLLAQEFAGGLNSNNRKGGLIGLASCAIALGRDMDEYLDLVVPAVLKAFADAESRVRYYACESLFNIAKVCRGAMVPFFNDVFAGLCKLVADVDQDCRNGAALLDRLVKEIVLETPPAELQVYVATFVPLLKSHMAGSVNPYVRQTLIGWVVALDSVPGVDLLPHVHDILGGLFAMLADGNREVRSAAYTALAGFLDQLDKASVEEEASWASSCRFLTLLDIVMSYTGRERDGFARLTAVEWLAHVLANGSMRAELGPVYDSLAATLLRCMADAHGGSGSSGGSSLIGGGGGDRASDQELVELCLRANADLQDLVRSTPSPAFDAHRLVRTVAAEVFLTHPDRLTRSCSLRWTGQLLVQCPAAVLACVDARPPLGPSSSASSLTNTAAAAAVAGAGAAAGDDDSVGSGSGSARGRGGGGADDSFLLSGGRGILDCLLRNLLDGSGDDSGRPATGGGGGGGGMASSIRGISSSAASGGSISDSDVLKLTLEVLARLAITDPSGSLRTRVLSELVRLLAGHRALLEGKAAFIIRRMCLLLEPRVVYLSLSSILASEPNREFASLLVELLNLLLLTALELSDFRDGLRGCAAAGAAAGGGGPITAATAADATASPTSVFLALYRTWVLNPVAALSLCLLAQAYELADRIVMALGEASVTLGLLMQVDKLVQLLESPVFLHTRLHLLQPEVGGGKAQAYLLRSLYGLLMLLPQGTAYSTLKDRLQAVTNLHIATGGALMGSSTPSSSSSGAAAGSKGTGSFSSSSSSVDTDALFAIFAASQASARAALSADLKARSLLSNGAAGGGAQGLASSGSGSGGSSAAGGQGGFSAGKGSGSGSSAMGAGAAPAGAAADGT